MPKLKNIPIDSAELIEFLETSSDFAFELGCLERLSKLGFQCQHAGSYVDRVTKKARQFDIRAYKESKIFRVRCAVECKNLSESFPLLILCVPRAFEESFHEVVFSFHPDILGPPKPYESVAFRKNCHTHRCESEYATGSPVGKNCVQVGKAADNSFVANDAEVFEKWSQALASAHDLADEAAHEGEERNAAFVSLILPIVVVPDGTLWRVDYNANGSRSGAPARTNRCSFFVGRHYSAGDMMRSTSLTISHLEFVTLSGLEDLTKNLLASENSWFPEIENQNVSPARS